MPATLRERIKERLDTLNIYAREASRRAGFSLGYVGDILDGRSKSPEMSRLIRLADVLECDVAYLIGTQDTPRTKATATTAAPAADAGPMIPLRVADGMAVRPWFSLAEEPATYVPPLPMLTHISSAYAVTVPADFVAPRYLAGEVIFMNPALPPRVGDFVFVKKNDCSAAIGRIETIDDKSLELGFLKPGAKSTLVAFEDMKHCHRIVGAVTP